MPGCWPWPYCQEYYISPERFYLNKTLQSGIILDLYVQSFERHFQVWMICLHFQWLKRPKQWPHQKEQWQRRWPRPPWWPRQWKERRCQRCGLWTNSMSPPWRLHPTSPRPCFPPQRWRREALSSESDAVCLWRLCRAAIGNLHMRSPNPHAPIPDLWVYMEYSLHL